MQPHWYTKCGMYGLTQTFVFELQLITGKAKHFYALDEALVARMLMLINI